MWREVTSTIPKGTLWTRGMALAEAEIEGNWTPIGRWSQPSGMPEAEAYGMDSRLREEPALQRLAA